MALKVDLKPHERLILGGAVISNGAARSKLLIENSVPVLREKDIIREKDAVTPCRKIYFIIQLMYIDDSLFIDKYDAYWTLVKDVAEAAPSTSRLLANISQHVMNKKYYPALKLAKKLINYEEEVTAHARNRAECL